MRIETIPLGKINPAPYNPRERLQPGDPAYDDIKASVEAFGLVEPLVWNERSGNLVGGHQRLNVLIESGATEVPCSVVDLDDDHEKALNIRLNKSGGRWDYLSLNNLLGELSVTLDDIKLTGYDENEVAQVRIISEHGSAGLPGADGKQDGEWKGMPDFDNHGKEVGSVIVHFAEEDDRERFEEIMGQRVKGKAFIWFPPKLGVERTIGKKEYSADGE